MHLDMPLPCSLPDDQAASQVTPGKDRCRWRSIEPQTMRLLRVYRCPSTVAGIQNKMELVVNARGVVPDPPEDMTTLVFCIPKLGKCQCVHSGHGLHCEKPALLI